MEEIVVVFIQIFFEFGLQLFASPFVDFSFGGRADKGCVLVFIHMLLGGGLGWLSTLLFPKLLLPIAALRLANLFVSPLVAGGIAYFAAQRFTKQDPWTGFLHGSLFALMFGMARYAAGTH
jgi:hypothetical protein